MKTNRLLRMLSLLAFLLLIAPFYDSCDGNYIHKVNNNGTEIEKSLSEKAYDVVIDKLSFNAFEIASLSIYAVRDITFKEFKEEVSKSVKKDLGVLISFLFDFIILISLTMVILSFTKKIKLLNKFAVANSILIIITFLYIIFLESSFEHFRQIKWGYYAFIIANLLISYYSKQSLKQQNSQFLIHNL
jgi:hypothetical protein